MIYEQYHQLLDHEQIPYFTSRKVLWCLFRRILNTTNETLLQSRVRFNHMIYDMMDVLWCSLSDAGGKICNFIQ